MPSFSNKLLPQAKLGTPLITQHRGNLTLLGEFNRGLSQLEKLVYNNRLGSGKMKIPNITILGDFILSNENSKNNRMLVASNRTQPGVIHFLDIYSHAHGGTLPHSHFYGTSFTFPQTQQSTAESLVQEILKSSKASEYSNLETQITNALIEKKIFRNTKNFFVDRYPDAQLKFMAWDKRTGVFNHLFITPPVVHPEKITKDYFKTVAAQNSRLESLKGEPIQNLLVFTQVNQPQTDPDLASKITATGRMKIQTGNIEDTTPRGQKEIEGLLQLGLDWITGLRKEFLPK